MNLAKKLLLSTEEAIPGKTIPELVEFFKLTETSSARSLSGYQTRIWYKWQDKVVVCHFNGFEDGESFIKIIDIVREKIKPDHSTFQGITDMQGYFDKSGLHVEIEYDGMIGNYLVYRGAMNVESIKTVKEWAQIIFAGLMDSENGKL